MGMIEYIKLVLKKENIEINQISITENLSQIKTINGYLRIYHTKKKGDKLDLSQYKGDKTIFLDSKLTQWVFNK